jgi:hypothetical protein
MFSPFYTHADFIAGLFNFRNLALYTTASRLLSSHQQAGGYSADVFYKSCRSMGLL